MLQAVGIELRYMDTFNDAELSYSGLVEYKRTDLVIGLRKSF